jgi:transposase
MVYTAIDIHKTLFQAAMLDTSSGEVSDARFPATREALQHGAMPLREGVAAVAIEATTGWRWVWRELSALGFDVRVVDPGQARALRGRTRKARTDRLDARWLCLLLAKEMPPQAWLPPAEIQRLRDKTRLHKRLVEDRTRWAQRLHAFLTHEGWACTRGRLLTEEGLRGFKMSVHAAARWYSWISPPSRSRRLISPWLAGRGGVRRVGREQRESAVWALAVVVGGVRP